MRRALVLLLLLPVAAGCGAKESSIADSEEALKDAGTSRIEWRLEQNSVEWRPSLSGVGTIDYAKERGEVVVVVERQKSKESSSQEMRAVYIGRDSYLAVPYRGKTLWQKLHGYEATGPDRFAPGPGGVRPDEVLDLLVKSSKKVEHLESDEIRGVSTEHYRAHIDEKAMGDDADFYERRGLVIDAWIDDDGLLRRIRIPFGGTEGPVEVIDLYDFGVPVDIEAPPADEVISEEKFNKLMDKECESGGEETAWCMLFGATIVESSGSEEFSPTETMPRRVEEKR